MLLLSMNRTNSKWEKNELGVSSDIYATRWYITLFSGGVVQYHTLLRIWDIYFLCGYDVFFFVAISLLKEYESKHLIYILLII